VASYSSSIVVQGLDSKRNVTSTLTLRGGGLPKMGAASWGLESRLSTTYYAGNPLDATQQFTVAGELPSEWSGEWNLTRLNRSPCSYDGSGAGGSAQDVVSPGTLIDVFESLQLAGTLVRATWTVDSDDPNSARTVTRIGRIKRFEAHYVRSMDVEWAVVFAWKSRGAQLGRVATTREGGASSASDLIAAAYASFADLVTISEPMLNSNLSINLSASQFSLGQLEQLAAYPSTLLKTFSNSIGRIVQQVSRAVSIINTVRSIPASLENTVVSLARDTVQQANQFADSISHTPSEQLSLSRNVADLARAARYFGQAHDQAQALSAAAQQAIAQVRTAKARAQVVGEQVPHASSGNAGGILAIYRTKAGDTPQSIAQKYYGTIDQDVAILRMNKLPYYQATFSPGTLLVIPVASPSASSSL
jgi:hypothetical protein